MSQFEMQLANLKNAIPVKRYRVPDNKMDYFI